MKRTLTLLTLLSSLAVSQADITQFNLVAGGLTPANEVPAVTNSSGSGDQILDGISYDSSTALLTFHIGYGSAQGFADLTGPATSVNIQGPAGTSETAAEQVDLSAYIVAAADASKGGTVIGSIGLNPEQSSNLLAGLDYVNIHTDANPDGELRGQLIPTTGISNSTSLVLTCPGDMTIECSNAPTRLTTHVSDSASEAFTLVWALNGSPVQTNTVAQGAYTNDIDIKLCVKLPLGTNVVEVTATDSAGNPTSCSSTIVVQDTTPPVITGGWVTPCVLWPPDHKMRPVEVRICAMDSCCVANWKIVSVTSNEAVGSGSDDGDKGKGNDKGADNDKGKGNGKKPVPLTKHAAKAPIKASAPSKSSGKGNDDDKGNNHGNDNCKTPPVDWVITGDHCLQLRAERSGNGCGRIYTITVQATDCAGNISAPKTLTVKVPHSQNGK
jgi:hypothetical protein